MVAMTRHRSGGFTLVELVIVMIVIAIMSAIVMAQVGADTKHSVTTQADQLRRNLSHLQLLAISQGARLKLTVTSGGYSVCAASTTNCTLAAAITDPATGQRFSVDVAIDGVSFSQGAGDYYFDSLGRPVSAASGPTLKPDMSIFTLSGGGRSVTVTVLPVTGFAQTTY
jgi:MSHA pilin protein MshC